jgi:hypothetical protein
MSSDVMLILAGCSGRNPQLVVDGRLIKLQKISAYDHTPSIRVAVVRCAFAEEPGT